MLRRSWLLLLLLLGACAAVPSAPPAPLVPAIPAGKAVVHIYRRALPFGPVNLALFDGATLIAVLPGGSYVDYYADPGPHVFKAAGAGVGSLPYATSLTAGQTYWLMVYVLGDQAKGNATLTQADEATAAKQMVNLKPAGP